MMNRIMGGLERRCSLLVRLKGAPLTPAPGIALIKCQQCKNTTTFRRLVPLPASIDSHVGNRIFSVFDSNVIVTEETEIDNNYKIWVAIRRSTEVD